MRDAKDTRKQSNSARQLPLKMGQAIAIETEQEVRLEITQEYWKQGTMETAQ